MRTLVIGAVVAIVGGFGLAGQANAQVIGTYGTPHANLGYYSPYPGALYSPYRQPTPIYTHSYNFNPGFHGGGYNTNRVNYSTFNQSRPYGSYRNPGYNRRW